MAKEFIFEPQALHALNLAKEALDKAIQEYNQCRKEIELNPNKGSLFHALDNAAAAMDELDSFAAHATHGFYSWEELHHDHQE